MGSYALLHVPAQAQTLCPYVRSGFRTQSKDKPDVIEANTTYLWRTLNGVEAKMSCASVPASLFRTQSESGLACVNQVSPDKQTVVDIDAAASVPFFPTGNTSFLRVST